MITWDSQSTSYSQPRTPWIQPGSPMTQPRFPYVDASKIFFELLLAFFFHRNFTPEILTNRKSYTGKYYTSNYTYWKMIHRNSRRAANRIEGPIGPRTSQVLKLDLEVRGEVFPSPLDCANAATEPDLAVLSLNELTKLWRH